MSREHQHNIQGWKPAQLGSLAGKTYVITGANTGTGFEATRVLLSKGAKVVMLNRNAEKSALANHHAEARIWQKSGCNVRKNGFSGTKFCARRR